MTPTRRRPARRSSPARTTARRSASPSRCSRFGTDNATPILQLEYECRLDNFPVWEPCDSPDDVSGPAPACTPSACAPSTSPGTSTDARDAHVGARRGADHDVRVRAAGPDPHRRQRQRHDAGDGEHRRERDRSSSAPTRRTSRTRAPSTAPTSSPARRRTRSGSPLDSGTHEFEVRRDQPAARRRGAGGDVRVDHRARPRHDPAHDADRRDSRSSIESLTVRLRVRRHRQPHRRRARSSARSTAAGYSSLLDARAVLRPHPRLPHPARPRDRRSPGSSTRPPSTRGAVARRRSGSSSPGRTRSSRRGARRSPSPPTCSGSTFWCWLDGVRRGELHLAESYTTSPDRRAPLRGPRDRRRTARRRAVGGVGVDGRQHDAADHDHPLRPGHRERVPPRATFAFSHDHAKDPTSTSSARSTAASRSSAARRRSRSRARRRRAQLRGHGARTRSRSTLRRGDRAPLRAGPGGLQWTVVDTEAPDTFIDWGPPIRRRARTAVLRRQLQRPAASDRVLARLRELLRLRRAERVRRARTLGEHILMARAVDENDNVGSDAARRTSGRSPAPRRTRRPAERDRLRPTAAAAR